MIHHTTTLLVLSTAAALLPAQTVSLEFSPNPVPPLTPVTITLTDSTGQGVVLPSPCTWVRIHQGSQQGPQVGPNLWCGQFLVNVPPNGTYQLSWDLRDPNGVPVPNGIYWMETRVWDAGINNLRTDWFALSVQGPNDASLTAGGNAAVGAATPLQVTSPRSFGGLYFAALSLDSRNPVTVLGLTTALSVPMTGDAFTNAFGVLDTQGRSSGLQLNVPNLPALRYLGLQLQSLVYDVNGFLLTNPLSLTVR